MNAERKAALFIQDERGALTTSYGPYVLRTAFQPIFCQQPDGHFVIEAFEALIRPERDRKPVSPLHFFSMIEPADALYVDTLTRELHIRNMGRMGRASAKLFVNFNPGLYGKPSEIDREVERMRQSAAEAGLMPNRIVCEITEQFSRDGQALALLVNRLRAQQFRIAVDDYGADDSDIRRVELLAPEVIKVDAAWVRRFSETPAGQALLAQLVDQFVRRNIKCLFEGLEEEFQIAFSQKIGVKLMQGYALARPELAPTSFNVRFPEGIAPVPATAPPAPILTEQPGSGPHVMLEQRTGGSRRPAAFGRRFRSV